MEVVWSPRQRKERVKKFMCVEAPSIQTYIDYIRKHYIRKQYICKHYKRKHYIRNTSAYQSKRVPSYSGVLLGTCPPPEK